MNVKHLILFFLFSFFLVPLQLSVSQKKAPKPLSIGYSVGITQVTPEKMEYAKACGITCIEVSLSTLVEGDKYSEEEIIKQVQEAKKAADHAGIQIWSVHMPFGKEIDLSKTNEQERASVVSFHKKVLNYCRILSPRIILFHPSFYLGLDERALRTEQMIRSAVELNREVKKIGAQMVIENMLGDQLLRDAERERPLCRTVEEMKSILERLPKSIGAAVDMNHIKNPEKLIRALGKRVKTVHVSDGDGKNECHYFPCSGEGSNNWADILSALHEAGYKGPFMYESKYPDVKELLHCYQSLYRKFITEYF